MRRLTIAAAMWCLAATGILGAQSTRPEDLAGGKLLVASPDLPDPNFAKTVVLLVEYGDDGVVGLILNRRSKIPLSRVLENIEGTKTRTDPVYAGGPVDRSDVLALVRGGRAPSGAKRILGDVFLVSSKEDMQKTFASAIDADSVHVYLGYAGWTAEQLDNEMTLGAWYIFSGNAKAVFESDPESLWDKLIHETELRIALNGPEAGADRQPRE